jgi:hypothetical protein
VSTELEGWNWSGHDAVNSKVIDRQSVAVQRKSGKIGLRAE